MEREKERKTAKKRPLSYNGRRCPKIPASRSKVVPSTSLTPQPRYLPLHPRIHLDDMAESQRSPTASGESNHLSKEKHRHKSEKGPSYILCTPPNFFSFHPSFLFPLTTQNEYIYIHIVCEGQKEGNAEREMGEVVPPTQENSKYISIFMHYIYVYQSAKRTRGCNSLTAKVSPLEF